MELFRQLVHGQTDKQTNKQTDGRTLLVPKVAIATDKLESARGSKKELEIYLDGSREDIWSYLNNLVTDRRI